MALMDEYLVGIDGPWTGEEAAHLWRRAGFGATPAQRTSAVGAGDQAAFRAAVDALVNIASDDPWLDGPTTGVPGTYGFPLVDLPDDESDLGLLKEALGLQNLIAHWLYRMRYSTQPLAGAAYAVLPRPLRFGVEQDPPERHPGCGAGQ
jgi:hypothetical protein